MKDNDMAERNWTYLDNKLFRKLDVQLKLILKKLIREKGITIVSLSKKTEVPLQTIHGWLQGSEPKNLRQVKAVADALEVDLDYLCFGIEPKVKNKIEEYKSEINAGVFEVVLRKIEK